MKTEKKSMASWFGAWAWNTSKMLFDKKYIFLIAAEVTFEDTPLPRYLVNDSWTLRSQKTFLHLMPAELLEPYKKMLS